MTEEQTNRNIKLCYFINAFKSSWFWLGIWIFYYFKFGGYKVVGIIEAISVFTIVVMQIPAGIIGDLIGKKKTIILGLIGATIGNAWMGFAPNLLHMILSASIYSIGESLIASNFQALIYDSLKNSNQEKKFKKVLNNTSIISLIVYAICGISSGYLYEIYNSLPFLLTSLAMIVALIFAFQLKEPEIDSEKFSINEFFKSSKEGFKQIFNKKIRLRTIGLLFISFITLTLLEGYNDIIAVESGFDTINLGYLFAITSFGSAISTYFLIKVLERFENKLVFTLSTILYSITLIISPILGIIAGGICLLIRYILDPIINNEISDILNSKIDSKYRATSISTYNMIKNIPYIIFIYTIGASSDIISPAKIALVLGLFLLTSAIANIFIQKKE